MLFAAQEDSRQRRRQGQSVKGRDRNGKSDGQGELLVENAGGAGKERDRYEYRNEHQRSSNDCTGHLSHSDGGGSARIGVVLIDMALHVLDHHDGVIDHQAGGQRDAEHGQRVDRKVENLDERKRSDQRDRDGDGGDDSRTPVEQKEKDDDNDDDDGFAQGAYDFANGVANNRGGIERHLVFHARWK